MHIRSYFILCLLLGLGLNSYSQEYRLHTDSEVSVEGTSNIKDWTATAADISGTLTVNKAFLKKGPGKGGKILIASFRIPVAGLDGGRGETMNDKIKQAFDAATHPQIQYQLTGNEVFRPDNDKVFKLNTTGQLTMAGQSQTVAVALSGTRQPDGKLVFTGSHKINMKDFGMEPPTAMFGQIEAGEWVTVHFTWVFEPNDEP